MRPRPPIDGPESPHRIIDAAMVTQFLLPVGRRIAARGLSLEVEGHHRADPRKGYVPAYSFGIYMTEMPVRAGQITLRLGWTEHVVRYAGHIGYGVRAAYRGQRLAARACEALVPLMRRHRFTVAWITCNPENVASRRTCEIVGAEFVEIVEVPPDNEIARRGEPRKCRYRWEVVPGDPGLDAGDPSRADAG